MNQLLTAKGVAQFQPLNDRLLVRRLDEPQGILYIPDIAQENSSKAEVMAIGKRVRDVSVGDVVLVPGAGNKYPDWEKYDLILIQQADIAGIIDGEKA